MWVFCFVFEAGSYYVAQASLRLAVILLLSLPNAGVCHHAWLTVACELVNVSRLTQGSNDQGLVPCEISTSFSPCLVSNYLLLCFLHTICILSVRHNLWLWTRWRDGTVMIKSCWRQCSGGTWDVWLPWPLGNLPDPPS